MATGSSDWKIFRPMSTPSAPSLNGLRRELQCFLFRHLLAAGDDDRRLDAVAHLVPAVDEIGLDDVGAVFLDDATGMGEVTSRIEIGAALPLSLYHRFQLGTDGRDAEDEEVVLAGLVGQGAQAAQSL